jgi:hypothetical protein
MVPAVKMTAQAFLADMLLTLPIRGINVFTLPNRFWVPMPIGARRLAHPKRFATEAAERADVPIAFKFHGKGGAEGQTLMRGHQGERRPAWWDSSICAPVRSLFHEDTQWTRGRSAWRGRSA